MSHILIVGCGNPLRCDDGLAWRALQDLSRWNLPALNLPALNLPEDIEVITQHQLTPELAFPISQADVVLFVDAARNGEAGEIRCEPVLPSHTSNAFSHNFSPTALLNLAQEVYGQAPPAVAISLCGESFDHGEKLSRSVEENMPQLLALIVQIVQERRDLTGSSQQ
jgi:hydrogenase maturation protease